MKHLVSLALKYIRRQKYRTLLTFLCITLSVFVLCLFADALILLRSMVLYSVLHDEGSWEVNVSDWLEKPHSTARLIDNLQNHVTVENFYYTDSKSMFSKSERDAEGYAAFFRVQVGDETPRIVNSLVERTVLGDPGLVSIGAFTGGSADADEIMLPRSYKTQGVKIGDTVTVTVTPVRAKISEEQPLIQEYEELMMSTEENAEKAGRPLFQDSNGITDDDRPISGTTLLGAMLMRGQAGELEMTDVTEGTPRALTFRVAGFNATDYSSDSTFSVNIGYGSKASLLDFDQKELEGLFAETFDMSKMTNEEELETYQHEVGACGSYLRIYKDELAYVRIHSFMDFDDAVEQLCMDMGFPEDDIYDMVHPDDFRSVYHWDLLRMEFRGADAIASWLDPGNPYFFAVFLLPVLLLLFWALMRFVIDNAFEISVQERSAQFSTLRIMGASRRQIAFLVCMEATAYSIAAVPLGVFLAYLCRMAIVRTMSRLAFDLPITSMPLITGIAVLLSLIAIYISAYTSSMWAARAYAPLEGTRHRMQSSNKKQSIWTKSLFGTKTAEEKILERDKKRRRPTGDLKAPKKSKLNRSRRSFLLNFTMRNIKRTRKRFIISVFTMTLGVGIFTFGLSFGAVVLRELNIYMHHEVAESERYDFYLNTYSLIPDDERRDIEETLGDKALFASYEVSIDAYSIWITPENYRPKFETYLPKLYADALTQNEELQTGFLYDLSFDSVTKQEYQSTFEKWLGMTYEEFVSKKAAVCAVSNIGPVESWTENERMGRSKYIPRIDTGFTPVSGTLPVLHTELQDDIPVLGTLVLPHEMGYFSVPRYLIPADCTLDMLSGAALKDSEENHFSTHINVTLSESEVYREAEAKLQETVDAVSSGGRIMYMTNNFLLNTGLVTLVRSIITVCAIVLAAVWLTGIFTMLNTVNTGVLNRCDELAMLRMIGMTQKQIRQTVSLESVIYCSIATVIGALLGIAPTLMLAAFIMDGSWTHPWAWMIGIVVGTLTVVVLVNLLIAKAAARPGLRALRDRLEAGRMMQ